MAKETEKTPPREKKISFEDAVKRLQQIVDQLENGQIGLQESLENYEQGIRYLRLCYRSLEAAERKIELLTSVDQQGRPQSVAFEEEELSLEEKAESRSRRRKKPPGQAETPPGLFE